MANVKRLRKAVEVRNALTQDMLKKVRHMYAECYVEISKKIEASSDHMTRSKLKVIRKDIVRSFESINAQIEKDIVTEMRTMCIAQVNEKRFVMAQQGFKPEDVEKAFFYVPERVVTSIVNGTVYNENWSLSTAIWGNDKKTISQIEYIISQGTAKGTDSYQIAKALEKYVNPNVAKKNRKIVFQQYKRDSSGNIIKDENGNPIPVGRKKTFYFGDVDYNASRLVRTMINHAYQQSFETVHEFDPFVTKYKWISAGQHGRTCQLCLDRDGRLFEKDELPMDHPNGMCVFEPYTPYTSREVTEKIIKWYHAPHGTYPDMDRYATTFLEG